MGKYIIIIIDQFSRSSNHDYLRDYWSEDYEGGKEDCGEGKGKVVFGA